MSRLCPKCGNRTRVPAQIDHRQRIRLDRTWYDVHIPALPVEKCSTCDAVYFGGEADSAIQHALREAAGLLQPTEIQHGMKALGIQTQRELAELLGVAPESLTRWMTGDVIQGRLANTLMSVFFACPEAREFLRRQAAGERRGFLVVPTRTRQSGFVPVVRDGQVAEYLRESDSTSGRRFGLGLAA